MSAIEYKLPTVYSEFIHLSRYSRWLSDKGRRETWNETVKRYFDFFEEHLKENNNFTLTKDLRRELEEAVLNLDVMPSMRCLMTAGPALKRENVAGYNCAYVAIDKPSSFDEILYILMNGTGVGFSVERQYINKLPYVADEFHDTDTVINVPDSKLGWAKSLKELIAMLYHGQIPKWDVSKIRPSGSILKTFGGRASGPRPLVELFEFCVRTFKNASGRKLTSIECHDIVCKIADIVVVGGVRRSALISLSNLSDDRMRSAKSGQWWETTPHRRLANNSAVYTEKPDIGIFMDEWKSLYDSKSGERGIFNRQSAQMVASSLARRSEDYEYGCNPCSEILLRSKQFCNLSEAIIRSNDTPETVKRKVRLATILGTFQATLTNFKYLTKEWKDNCEEERLLGVSLTGIKDNLFFAGKKDKNDLKSVLNNIKLHAIEINKAYAKELGINPATAITCVKPSGTVSQLVDCASGIHSRYNEHYIRTVRGDKKDPLTQFMVDMGFPVEDCVMAPNQTAVFSFPIKCDKNAVFRNDETAIEQLELWLLYQQNWCEHKPSVTIDVKKHEWLQVASWVYDNFDWMSGVSFLPNNDHVYPQAPYQDCTEEQYNELLAKLPQNIVWEDLSNYEKEDNTVSSQSYACSGGVCEVVNIGG